MSEMHTGTSPSRRSTSNASMPDEAWRQAKPCDSTTRTRALRTWSSSSTTRPRAALERNVASLEGATHGFAFGSGLAALDAVLKLLKVGDHVVCGENVYGGSMRLMTRVYAELGLEFSFVDMREIGPIERAITPRTRMVYC